jgi:hypothetical protein
LRILLDWLANPAWEHQWWRRDLLLQKGTALPCLRSGVWKHRWRLLATEDNLLKQEDVIFPINVGLGDNKYVIKE